MHTELRKRTSSTFAGVVLVLLLTGCVSSITPEGMVAPFVLVHEKHPYSVSVTVAGGRPSSTTHPAQISNSALKQAIEETIRQSQVFAQLRDWGDADYKLNVILFQLEQPAVAFTKRIFIEIGWSLTHRKTGAEKWKKAIQSTSVGQDLAQTTEGAARDNIRQALEQISQLQL